MADGQHKLSRRAVLGAVCVGPLVRPCPPRHSGIGLESVDTVGGGPDAAVFMDSGVELRSSSTRRDDEWDRALARFGQAQAVLAAAVHEEDEDAYDLLLDSHSDALCALLALPAPDLAGLADKLDVIVPQLAWELTGCEDCLERLREDVHRLAAAAA